MSTNPSATQRTYKARYRAKPETKIKEAEYKRRYYALNKDKLIRQTREWQNKPENKGKKRKRSMEYKAYNAEYSREWRQRNKETVKGYRQKARIKREAEYAASAGRPKPAICDICARKNGNIVFDHCHKGGHFRGFLCDRCNTVLGLMEDNASLFAAMISYLRRTKDGTPRQSELLGI